MKSLVFNVTNKKAFHPFLYLFLLLKIKTWRVCSDKTSGFVDLCFWLLHSWFVTSFYYIIPYCWFLRVSLLMLIIPSYSCITDTTVTAATKSTIFECVTLSNLFHQKRKCCSSCNGETVIMVWTVNTQKFHSERQKRNSGKEQIPETSTHAHAARGYIRVPMPHCCMFHAARGYIR